MPVAGFPPAIQSHEGSQEGDGVDVTENDGDAGVEAERLHRGEVGRDADGELEDVGQGGDGDWQDGFFVGVSHSLRDWVIDFGVLPVGHHDEHVVEADSLERNHMSDVELMTVLRGWI